MPAILISAMALAVATAFISITIKLKYKKLRQLMLTNPFISLFVELGISIIAGKLFGATGAVIMIGGITAFAVSEFFDILVRGGYAIIQKVKQKKEVKPVIKNLVPT